LLYFDALFVAVGTRKLPTREHPHFAHVEPFVRANLVSVVDVDELVSSERAQIQARADDMFRLCMERPLVIEAATGDVMTHAELRDALHDVALDFAASSRLGVPFKSSTYFSRVLAFATRYASSVAVTTSGEFLTEQRPSEFLGVQILESFGGARDLGGMSVEEVLELRHDPSFAHFRRWVSRISQEMADAGDVDNLSRILSEIESERRKIDRSMGLWKRLTSFISFPLAISVVPVLSGVAELVVDEVLKRRAERSPLRFPSLVSEAARLRKEVAR
jgi:hypothetical protein